MPTALTAGEWQLQTYVMSGIHELAKKTKEGTDWRGTITVEEDGDEIELTVRNLTSPEIEDVFRLIDREELETLEDELPTEQMDERRELLEMDEDERTDAEQERLDELTDELEGTTMKLFDILSKETFNGIRLAAKKGVVPSQEEMREAVKERAHEIEQETGRQVAVPEDTFDFLKDELQWSIENNSKFIGFQIGMKVLRETGETKGN